MLFLVGAVQVALGFVNGWGQFLGVRTVLGLLQVNWGLLCISQYYTHYLQGCYFTGVCVYRLIDRWEDLSRVDSCVYLIS